MFLNVFIVLTVSSISNHLVAIDTYFRNAESLTPITTSTMPVCPSVHLQQLCIVPIWCKIDLYLYKSNRKMESRFPLVGYHFTSPTSTPNFLNDSSVWAAEVGHFDSTETLADLAKVCIETYCEVVVCELSIAATFHVKPDVPFCRLA